MDLVTNFCIDRYEASLVVFVEGGNHVPWTSYAEPPDTLAVLARSVARATPQAYVDYATALGACLNAGKRLCTDSEWLRACRGPSGFTYPWGNAAEPGRCNDSRAVHPLVEYYQTTEPWIYDHLDQPCVNQLPAGLERTGMRPGCASAEGPFDLYGNLAEWVFDPNGTVRGGHYAGSAASGAGCLWVDVSHDETHREFAYGFRCCADLFP
jgi:formylglycine-generating enzyme required for sulfatase activity